MAVIFFRPGVETFEVPAEGGEIQVFYEFDQQLENTGLPGELNFNIFFDNTQIELTAQDVTAEAGNITNDFTLGGENDDLAETNEGLSLIIGNIATPDGEQPFLTIPITPTSDLNSSIIKLTTGNPPTAVDNLTFVNGQNTVTLEDMNEPPEFGDDLEFTVNSNQAGEFSASIVPLDDQGNPNTNPDPEGADVTFEITDGNDPNNNGTGAFEINDDGVITVVNADELPERGVFNLEVQATDTSPDQVSSTEEVTINVTAGNLDIGGNGEVDQSDALLLQAQLFGTPGLIQAVSDDFNRAAPGTVTQTPTEIETFIQDNPSVFDIGGNGEVDQSDALLLQAQLFGTPGLIQAVSNDFNRAAPGTVTQIPTEIEQFIADNSPAA